MIIAVIPEPSSPKNGRPHPTQLPTACRGEPSPLAQYDSNAHNPLTLVLRLAVLPSSSPSAKRGLAADPVSSSVETARQREGRSRRFVDPRARRATHHGLQAWLHGLGKTRSADWAGSKLARGAVAAVAVLPCRQAGCVPAGGWLGTRSIHYCK